MTLALNSTYFLFAVGTLLIVGLLFGLIYLQRRRRELQAQLAVMEQTVTLREKTSQALSQRGLQQQHLLWQLRTAVDVMESGPVDLEPAAFLQDMAQRLRHHFNFYAVTIFELDKTQELYVPVAHANRDGRVLVFGEHVIGRKHPQSVVARAGRTGEAAVVNDASKRQDQFMVHAAFPNTRSELALPLLVQDTLLGVLDLQDTRTNRFYTADVDTFTAVARHIATNLEKSRLLEDLRQKFTEAELLNELTTAVNQSLSVSDVLNTAATKVVDLIPAVSHCGIGLFNEDYTHLTIEAEHPGQTVTGITFHTHESYTVRDIVEKKQPIVINDTSGEALPISLRHNFEALGVRSVLIVPVIAQGQLYGSLGMDVTGATSHAFTEDEIRLALNVANQIGGAIQRAVLLREAEEAHHTAVVASNAQSSFLANMSHELLTPLSAIIGYSEIVLDALASDSQTAPHTADIQHVHQAGRHLRMLITDLLDHTQLNSGQATLFLTDFDVCDTVRALEAELAPQIATNGNVLHLYLAQAPAIITADREKVYKIMSHLLDNANKFTSDGHISLRIEPDAERSPTHWQLVVQDSGIGMSESQLRHLFRPFMPGDTSLQRRYGGSGLGLSLCDRYCRLMGGEIEVDSKLGEGTTFWVRLPLTVQPNEAVTAYRLTMSASATPPSSRSPAEPSLPDVLVIEDNARDRELLVRYLQKTASMVHTASHGREALAYLEQSVPDLIVLDLLMPEMDGFQFLNKLYNTEVWQHIPVIVVTAKNLSPDEQLFLHQHAHRVLRKGHYGQKHLLQAIRDMIAYE